VCRWVIFFLNIALILRWFWIQAVTQQKVKGYEYFLKALKASFTTKVPQIFPCQNLLGLGPPQMMRILPFLENSCNLLYNWFLITNAPLVNYFQCMARRKLTLLTISEWQWYRCLWYPVPAAHCANHLINAPSPHQRSPHEFIWTGSMVCTCPVYKYIRRTPLLSGHYPFWMDSVKTWINAYPIVRIPLAKQCWTQKTCQAYSIIFYRLSTWHTSLQKDISQ
jgi:hypothetical protein